jgi:hypothetical protein
VYGNSLWICAPGGKLRGRFSYLDMAKVGRPSGLTKEIIAEAERFARLGLTDQQMADAWGIDRTTVHNWKKSSPEFLNALKEGKERSDAAVGQSLYQRACGYTWTEETPVKVKDADGNERVEVVEITKRVPPDTTAAIFWLKNRQRAKWRDRQDHEVSGHVTHDGPAYDLARFRAARRTNGGAEPVQPGTKPPVH